MIPFESFFSSQTFIVESVLNNIEHPLLQKHNIRLFLKRDDLLHPLVSGNKWRKMKYNLLEMKEQGKKTLLTFGGAFSNHLYAAAAAGQMHQLKTIGLVRGEDDPHNPTLQFARACGMELHFLSRSDYRHKNDLDFLGKLIDTFGEAYLLPEGGSNAAGIRGASEIPGEVDMPVDYWCVPLGTGGTMAGIVAGTAHTGARVLGFPALKGDFPAAMLEKLLLDYAGQTFDHWEMILGYDFGGYARVNKELLDFIAEFKHAHNILADPVYTGKMLYGIFDRIRQGALPEGATIVAVHTGGLQGWNGMQYRFSISPP